MTLIEEIFKDKLTIKILKTLSINNRQNMSSIAIEVESTHDHINPRIDTLIEQKILSHERKGNQRIIFWNEDSNIAKMIRVFLFYYQKFLNFPNKIG